MRKWILGMLFGHAVCRLLSDISVRQKENMPPDPTKFRVGDKVDVVGLPLVEAGTIVRIEGYDVSVRGKIQTSEHRPLEALSSLPTYTFRTRLADLRSPRLGGQPAEGLIHRWIVDQQRQRDIDRAIKSYREAGKLIPVEWILEYNEILTRRNRRLTRQEILTLI